MGKLTSTSSLITLGLTGAATTPETKTSRETMAVNLNCIVESREGEKRLDI